MDRSYYGWSDHNGKKAVDTKVREGITAFQTRWGRMPECVLMNAVDFALYHGPLAAIESAMVRANDFWFGYVEGK